MRILIINPPIRLTDKPRHLPHGLAILANLIRKKLKITPEFLDINAYRYTLAEVKEILRSIEYDVVLIGGLIPVYKRITAYADIIKKINPNSIIIAGGSAAMSVPDLLLDNSVVDVVCAGEGEKVIIKLLEGLQSHSLENLTRIKGFYYKVNNEIIFSGSPDLINDLDTESDLPAYDLLPMEIYLSNPVVGFGRDVDFISSRGCPFKCSFCYQPWGAKFRAYSVNFIIDALSRLKKDYQIDFVSFQDDEFMAHKSRVVEFCEKVQREIPGLLWSCTGRVNLVNDDIVGVMKKAGCVSVSYGFESGSPHMLKSMNKSATIKQMENAVSVSRKYNMMLPVSFIIGMPGEDNDSCSETVEFCVKNNLPLKSMMFATPYPGTKLFEYAISSGRILKEDCHEFILGLEDARDFVINLTDAFTDQELIDKRDEMMKEVNSRVDFLSTDAYKEKLRSLFGAFSGDCFDDESLVKHRAEHGGLDLF
jgi:anaerobic magnesium-protoporphyrin IX monomethyl ester cyclase